MASFRLAGGDPVRIHTAMKSEHISFHLYIISVAPGCVIGTIAPLQNRLERANLVRGFQHAKDQYVPVTKRNLKASKPKANKSIDLKEFIPLATRTPGNRKQSWIPENSRKKKVQHLLLDMIKAIAITKQEPSDSYKFHELALNVNITR